MQELTFDSIDHAHLTSYNAEEFGRQIQGRSSVRYLRFREPVRVGHIELPLSTDVGRWVPDVPGHPAHLVFSVLDRSAGRWRTVRDIDLPPDGRVWGDGLSDSTPFEAIEEHFAAVAAQTVHSVDLGDVQTDCLRVECDREHPVWPNHGECNGGTRNVPFGILNPIRAYGSRARGDASAGDDRVTAERLPLLAVHNCAPQAPSGMRVRVLPSMVLYESPQFAVGFSLRRPILMHLGWNAWETAETPLNRLRVRGKDMRWTRGALGGLSGPLLRGLDVDEPPHLWGGSVEISGSEVVYRVSPASRSVENVVRFSVHDGGMTIDLEQSCPQDVQVLEAEGWRLAWDLGRAMTAPAAVAEHRPGRSGAMTGPVWFATDDVGCLMCVQDSSASDPSHIQTESYRSLQSRTDGFVLANRPESESVLTLPAGTRRARYVFSVDAFEPLGDRSEPGPSDTMRDDVTRRYWGGIFACYRPELGGFSNNAISTNVHSNHWAPVEIAVRTRVPTAGPSPVDLARFTIERAILGGGGYGFHRDLYLDSDPILVSMAALVYRATDDLSWLRQIEPGLRAAYERMAGAIDESGLVVCSTLSGNTGSHRWSCNAMDVVGFGHLDAYVNAWTYRAMRCLVALFRDLGTGELSDRAGRYADRLQTGFAPAFLNPDTGWVAGWRSRDGQLHDYAFIWVNAVAIAFGLLDEGPARVALEGLERLRHEVGLGDAGVGLPTNLLPILPSDQMYDAFARPGQPVFEFYTDGGLSGSGGYYIRALDRYGLSREAETVARELLAGYEAGLFTGPIGGGQEFLTWEGIPTGYEGTLVVRFDSLWAIATQLHLTPPLEPEWWSE